MPTGGNWKEMLYASQQGDLELLKYHVRMGIDINYRHPEFMTNALIESLRFGHIDIAQFLLEQGATTNTKDEFSGDTPMSLAKALKNKKVIKMVESYQQQENPSASPSQKILATNNNSDHIFPFKSWYKAIIQFIKTALKN